jgi:hypothetical protein
VFERFTEPARRAIFFARYEAGALDSPQIEAEHLLLGLLREDKMLKHRLQRLPEAVNSIRQQIQASSPVRPQIATQVDLPLSEDCQRVLAYAAEESKDLQHQVIDCGHLVLGLLMIKDHYAVDLFQQHGISYTSYRETVRTAGTAEPVVLRHLAAARVRAFERTEPEAPEIEPAAPSLVPSVTKLKSLLDAAVENLNGYSPQFGEQRLKRKPWSRKEALGHLVDMATAHHVWFVRVLAEPKVTVNEYPQDEWVRLEHYDRFSWPDLVDLWLGLNRLLIHVLVLIPEEKTKTPFRIGIEEPVTLQALVKRYVAVCDDILGEILSAL